MVCDSKNEAFDLTAREAGDCGSRTNVSVHTILGCSHHIKGLCGAATSRNQDLSCSMMLEICSTVVKE